MTTIRYELDTIEKYILDAYIMQDATTAPPEPTMEQSFRDEVNRVKSTFMHELCAMTSEHHLERYIRHHQQSIIDMMDMTRRKTTDVQTGDTAMRFLRFVLHALEDLLGFVEKNFSSYVDLDVKCPDIASAIARREAKMNLLKIHKGLMKLGVGSMLTNVLLQPLWRVAAYAQQDRITYRDVTYTKTVQQDLLELVRRENKPQDILEELHAMVYSLNVNTMQSFSYCVDAVVTGLKNVDTRQERIETLSLRLKKINQVYVKPGLAYNHELPSLKFQVIEYIMEEIQHMERTLLPKYAPPSDGSAASFKIRYEISVSQLSYMMKLFIETKLVRNTNLTELLRFVARTAVTKRAEEVSFDSLRTKYYNVEKGARESVRTLLTSMIRFIDTDQS